MPDARFINVLVERVLSAAEAAQGPFTFKLDVGRWSGEEARGFVNALTEGAQGLGMAVLGIRTDTAGFRKLGVTYDNANSGLYGGSLPVVATDVEFGTLEVVLRHER